MLNYKNDNKIESVEELIKDAAHRSKETENGNEKPVEQDPLDIEKEK